ncbi:hypothetical protein GGI07_003178 [Coemansia sp. Benny D115]|nr:hypothetical protein GGI07_003178 [Coemansia sp. Benny D115]
MRTLASAIRPRRRRPTNDMGHKPASTEQHMVAETWSQRSAVPAVPAAPASLALDDATATAAGSSASSGVFGGDSNLLKRVSSMPGNLSLFRAHLTHPLRQPEFRAAPTYTQRQAQRMAATEPDDTPLYGYALLAVTAVMFVVLIYALVVSKLFMPVTGVWWLDAVKEDRYFCLLVPITGLSFTFAVFWNWLGMKFFRHN